MYTEDDEKVKVKKSNSNNNDYNDFYNAFNDTEADHEEEKKNTKKEKKNTKKKETPPKKEEKIENEETEYSFFYNTNEAEFPQTDKKNLKKIIIICGLAILAIILVILSIVIIKSITRKDIELLKDNFSLKVGESDYISYEIVNEDVTDISGFTSSDNAIAIVDDNGMITGISSGEATISFTYFVNGRERTKKVTIVVEGEPTSDDITLNVLFSNGKADTWTKEDVTLNIETTGYVSSVRYAINCSGECSYNEVINKQIKISSNGVNNVRIVANGRNNKEEVKEVVVKIDKEPPKATISNRNVSGNDSVEVCATCSDNESGCEKSKVCKKYTASASNQVITVTDKAGNKANSPSYNVTVSKPTGEPCTLSVSSDGVVTATVNGNASYYGFNSSYSGTNELSKKIDINASKAGDSFAKVVFYFVKNNDGSGGKCYITVIKECRCTNSSSTSANCPVTCTFKKG